MAKYRECPECGATLDFGEPCDCTKKEDASAATETSSKNNDVHGIVYASSIANPSGNVNETEGR